MGSARRRPPAIDGVGASRFQVPPGPSATVLDALCAAFPAIPASQWRERFARGHVLDADGHPLPANAAARAGLELHYYRDVPDEPLIVGEARVLHRDAHLLVADKPHFLPVVPAGRFVRDTLLARLVRQTGIDTLVPLHRIDRATAGLVLFSVEPRTRDAYQALFRERRIRKRYAALAPALPGRSFPLTHCSRIVRGEPFFRMREVDGEPNSETRIEVLSRDAAHWRYALEPVTGRKHQLRVHMASLGAPILGDPLYPDLDETALAQDGAPLQLLAQSLAFEDPLDGTAQCFESEQSLFAPSPPGRGPG
ncbi:pseudouridine synthase [Luteimonas aestuarii]|uniref:Pseudouridine synthase n=1 Tax=Luteimonas aestuarii TaxID=453837 RepID=A0A4R5TNE2_9GAMM|nr:pseudouridine synthase [Luteimonas aestuarii]TDK21098.1 pseudouridine synthase [Luteimonas aestuarii]